jgi:hypothetical protein
MAQLLTYSQVRESGLFAWHADGYLFIANELIRAVRLHPPASDACGYSDVCLHVRRSSLRGGEHLVESGWHHLDGCTCGFCAASEHSTVVSAVPRAGSA